MFSMSSNKIIVLLFGITLPFSFEKRDNSASSKDPTFSPRRSTAKLGQFTSDTESINAYNENYIDERNNNVFLPLECKNVDLPVASSMASTEESAANSFINLVVSCWIELKI